MNPFKLAIVNQKGGVGKTTTAINLAYYLSKLNKKILLIDFDPQSSVSEFLGIDLTQETLQVMNFLLFTESLTPPIKDISKLVQTKYGFDVIPTKRSLTLADPMSYGMVGRERLLRDSINSLDGINNYDIVIIDCPPAPGFLNNTAFYAADGLLVAIQTEFLSLAAFKTVLKTQRILSDEYKESFRAEIFGILPTMADERLNITKETTEIINKRFPNKVFKTHIRRNVSIAESPAHFKPIGEYKPGSTGAKDYSNLSNEVLGRINNEQNNI